MSDLIKKETAVVWFVQPYDSTPLTKKAESIVLQFRDAKQPPVAVYMEKTGNFAVLWDFLAEAGLPMRILL